jgi:membrane carboxypeptidase/penicillin-binding protein PbpC
VVNPGTCVGVSLLTNCSFELPTITAGTYSLFSSDAGIDGWTVAGAAGNVDTLSTTFTQNGYSFVSEDGQQAMDLTGTTNTATGVAQTVTTTVGTHYTLSFWVGNVVNPDGIFGVTSTVNVLINGTQVLAAENSGGMGTTMLNWQQFSWEFVAASTATTIAFINGDPSNDTSNFIDNVILSVASAQ